MTYICDILKHFCTKAWKENRQMRINFVHISNIDLEISWINMVINV